MATEKPTTIRNLDGYDAPVIPWDKVRSRLDKGRTEAPETRSDRQITWLATTNSDGSPHVMPLGGVWIDGFVYFTSSPDAVKAKNLVNNPACSISVSTADFDLVIEGEVSRVTAGAEPREAGGRVPRRGLAGSGRERCLDRPVQRSERGAAALVRVQAHPGHDLRPRHVRPIRCDALPLLGRVPLVAETLLDRVEPPEDILQPGLDRRC